MLVFKKIASVLLSFVVLFSTFSFTVEKHYCGDFLVDVSYFGEANNCGMKMKKQSKKRDCCKDEIAQIKGQQDLQKLDFESLSFEQQQFLVAHIFSYINFYLENELDKEFYKDFSPPDIEKDFQVLYETYLI